jgi:hypothetical protein
VTKSPMRRAVSARSISHRRVLVRDGLRRDIVPPAALTAS